MSCIFWVLAQYCMDYKVKKHKKYIPTFKKKINMTNFKPCWQHIYLVISLQMQSYFNLHIYSQDLGLPPMNLK